MMWFGYGVHWLWMVAFWVVAIALVAWAIGRLAPPVDRGGDEARRILDERFARGELDLADYRRLRQELGR